MEFSRKASPSYDYDLGNGAYSASINLNNGNWDSPVFKRTGYSSTAIKVPMRLDKTFYINYFYYSEVDARWKSIGFTNVKFSLLVQTRSINHGSPGVELISRCFLTFVDVSVSPRKFNVEISGSNAYVGGIGGILT